MPAPTRPELRRPVPASSWAWVALVVTTYGLAALPGGVTFSEDAGWWALLEVALVLGVLWGSRLAWIVALIHDGTLAVLYIAGIAWPASPVEVALVLLMIARTAFLLSPGTRIRMRGGTMDDV